MNVLQTIDLKKYYGSEPNITRALDGKIVDKIAAGGKNCQNGNQEVEDHDMAF